MNRAWPARIEEPIHIRGKIERTERGLVGVPKTDSVWVGHTEGWNATERKIGYAATGEAGRRIDLPGTIGDLRGYGIVG